MNELEQYISMMLEAGVNKIIISNLASKTNEIKKIVIDKKSNNYQIANYTKKQVFHENITENLLKDKCISLIWNNYHQVNGISENEEHIILISKK